MAAPELDALRIERKPKPPRRSNPWPGRVLWLAALALGGWLFARPIGGLLDRVRLLEVELVSVVQRSPSQDAGAGGAAANGYVVARTRAALSAERPGRLVEIHVEEGSRVQRGDVVARIDHEEQDANLERADAELALAQRGVDVAGANLARAEFDRGRLQGQVLMASAEQERAQAHLNFATKAVQRFDTLRDEGVVDQHRLDEAMRDREAAQASRAGAQASLASAQAGLEVADAEIQVARRAEAQALARVVRARTERGQALAALEKTYVRAPFEGIVVNKEAEVGEVVSPNSQGGSTARGSVATMVDFASLEAQAEVPETSLAAVQEGAPARIYLDAFPDQPYEGTITRIWPTANRQKATVEVRVSFHDLDERLRPEMGLRVVFLSPAAVQAGAPEEAVLMIPADSVINQAGESGVFVWERGAVRFQVVELGPARGSRVVVLAGLHGDEQLVLSPPVELQSGQRVRTQR